MNAVKRLSLGPRPAMLALAVLLLVLAGLAARYLFDRRPVPPVCVVISPTEGPVKGLESAEYVYEWRLPEGGSQMLAVFTSSDWEAGPVGTLSLGAADIADTYGRIVCRDVRPEAEEYFARYGYHVPPIIIYRSQEAYVRGKDVLSWFNSKGDYVPGEWDYSMPRGRLIGGSRCSTIKGTRNDGSIAFEWRWNGKQYEKVVGTMPVTASAVVVLFTYEQFGLFPDGRFLSDVNPAIACAEGRAAQVTWWSMRNSGVVLECPGVSGEERLVHLPKGRIWFEIVTYGEYDCSYGE